MFLFILAVFSKSGICPVVADECKLKMADGAELRNHFQVQLGTRCELRFTNCIIGKCYTIFDHTFRAIPGNPGGPVNSIFSDFSIFNGVLNWQGSFVSYRPYSSTFYVNFTIKSPKEFYKLHPQLRANKTDVGELSEIYSGFSGCN